MEKENVLISACLIGVNCRYDGNNNYKEKVERLKEKYNLIPVCSELFGGLKTPRTPAERLQEKIITRDGEDVTYQYTKGAEEVLKVAKFYNAKLAILKERSPSCGFGKIYDGTFSKTLIEGNGVTADLLFKNGIEVIGENSL